MPLPQLTFTRFVAALIVLIFHGARGSFPFTVYPGRYLVEYGSVAVIYFFTLSGFILTIAYQPMLERTGQINRRTFWVARLARIYPLYLFALLLMAFTLIRFYDTPVTPAQLLASLTLTQSWFPTLAPTINGPGWSLSVEAFFYVIFPLVFPVLSRLSSRTLLVLLPLVWGVSVGLFYWMDNQRVPAGMTTMTYHSLINYSPWVHLGTFINGCLSGLLFWRYMHQPIPVPTRNRNAWLMLLLGVLGLVLVVPQKQWMHYAQGGLIAPIFMLFIVGLGSQIKTPLTRLLSWAPLVYLGEISYGLYILQMPVIWLLKKNDPLQLGDTLQRDLFTFVALFVATILCHHLIERPAQAYIRGRQKARLSSVNR